MIFFRKKHGDIGSQNEMQFMLKNFHCAWLFGVPSRSVKKRMKSRLMSVINDKVELSEYAGVIPSIKVLSDSVSLSRESRVTMRRRIMNRISLDLGSFSFFDVFVRGVFSRAAVASVMIFVVSFVSIFTFQLNTPISYAKDSTLYNVEGDVYIYRAGTLLPVLDGFILKEGDKIHTGYDSSATAIFMDDTVSRIDGDSKLNLSRLSVDEAAHRTEITLGVAEGRVWSKTAPIISGSFNVATLHTVIKVQRNATFDVNVKKEERVEISVVENFVNVELSSYSPAVTTTVVEGESLIVSADENMIVSLDDQDSWFRINMSKDEFESRLFAQEDVSNLEEEVGLLPTDIMYGIKTFKENLGVVLSINQREKLENQLTIAHKRLAEAELLLNKGLSGSAEEVLKEYKQIMLDITREYDDLIGIESIEAELSAMIANDAKRYYTTLPGSSLYDVKEVVEEVEFLLANDRIRSNQIALKHASDDLYQVFDLLKHGGKTMAEVSIGDYPTVLENALRDLNVYYQADKGEYVRVAFEIALSDLKTINALYETVDAFGTLDVDGMRDRVVATLDENFAIFNKDASLDDLVAGFEVLQDDDFDKLVELSEFVGVSDQNAATVDVAIGDVSGDYSAEDSEL